jgi:hypothetical protein
VIWSQSIAKEGRLSLFVPELAGEPTRGPPLGLLITLALGRLNGTSKLALHKNDFFSIAERHAYEWPWTMK